jgi:hypothetical protein
MNRLTSSLLACFFAAISMAAPTSGGAQVKGKSAPSQEGDLILEDYAVYSAVLLDRGKPNLILSDVTDSTKDGKSGM